MNRTVVILATTLALASCNTPSGDQAAPPLETVDDLQDTPESDEATEPDAELHASGCPITVPGVVTATPDCLEPWPLTVDTADIFCDGAGHYIDTSAGVYPINGQARSARPELPPLEDIWAENPDIDGTRINIGGMNVIAGDLC